MSTERPHYPWPDDPFDFGLAPTMAELEQYDDDLIRGVIDWWAYNRPGGIGYEFWVGELRRRVEVNLTNQLVTATASMEKLLKETSKQTSDMILLAKLTLAVAIIGVLIAVVAIVR